MLGKASTVLDRLGLGIQTPTASKPQCSTREIDGINVVDLRGKIAFGTGNTLLREAIAGLIAAGSQKVLLNMKDVDFIDSSGIGELVRSHMAIRKQGGEMKLAGLSPVSYTHLDVYKRQGEVLSDQPMFKRLVVAGIAPSCRSAQNAAANSRQAQSKSISIRA